MHVWHCLSLIVIASAWVAGWRVAYRWSLRCGVSEKPSAGVLACVLPTAGLVVCAHLTGLASMLSGRGLYTPETVAGLFVVLVLAVGRVLGSGAPSIRSLESDGVPDVSLRRVPGWWCPVAVVVGVYLVFWVEALTRYPSGTDALHNHLPVAVRWIRTQAMDLVYGVTPESWPENAMIVPSLLSSLGYEKLLTFVHLPKALLLAAAIYGLARVIGVGRTASLLASCIAASVPIVVFQSFSGYVDLYAAASWLSALLAIVWASRTPDAASRRGLLVIAGLSAGVALGAKTTFLILTALLVLAVAAIDWVRPAGDEPRGRRIGRHVAVFSIATLVCSGFWFVRATVQAGNPLYPAAVTVGGMEILPGTFRVDENYARRPLGRKVWRWLNYPWQESKGGKGYAYGVDNGLGAAYASFVPLGVLAAGFSLFNRRKRSFEDGWRLIYLVMVIAAVVLLLTVYREIVRYVLPVTCLAAALAAVMLDRLLARHSAALVATLTAALLVTAGLTTLKPVHSALGRARDGRWTRAWYYQIPTVFDDLEPGACVLNLTDPSMTYPLMGEGLRNEVVSPIRWQARLDGRSMCAAALRENDIDYIYVRAPWPEDWPEDLPVALIHDDTDSRALSSTIAARVYRVLPESDEVFSSLVSTTSRRDPAAPE